ncbi:hypothetical protein [Cardinium endosymbiont of Oedothorax gibbosus]|uniref:hypothetical protein n=1 Tax=Cardinium endosymbiont of Oedothorax gibbosus TaxID=931101 RepID=UPI0020240834|nr:hypothetical protein [Cardinium endosymbiont of Oedothorax gibbosus]CAH2559689.1 HD-domain/PDEase-like superfamily protein [Cardinium endosymbiont of Oedothorax gibbosus]
MKRNEILNLNDWNLHQLTRAVSETPKEIKHTWPKIQEAYSWAERIARQANSKMFKHSLRASIEVAMIAVMELSLGLPGVITAILAPPFLQGLVQKATIQKRFGLKIVSILVELNRLKRYKLYRGAMLNGQNASDLAVVRIVAILLQICDIVRVSYRGVPLGSLDSELIYYSSSKLFLDLKCFYIPFSHRMRLYNIQAKLADFWFKHTDTLGYYSITAELGMTKLQRQQTITNIYMTGSQYV